MVSSRGVRAQPRPENGPGKPPARYPSLPAGTWKFEIVDLKVGARSFG